MPASYPSSIKSFTTKNPGDTIASASVNDLQLEVTAIETDLRTAFPASTGATGGQFKFPATQNASTDANTLDDYEEGTFTAALSFGGGTTGITYNAATTLGSAYVKIGKNVWVSGYIELTNKGSSTGAALITGLPFTSEANNRAATIAPIGVFTGLTGATQGQVVASSTTIAIYQSAADTSASVTDTAFTNTTYFFYSAFYRASA